MSTFFGSRVMLELTPRTFNIFPAMEAGVADHVWSLEEVINLVE
jgi:hypothetical protein